MKGRREFSAFGLCMVMAIATLMVAGCASSREASHASDVMKFVPVKISAGEAVDGWRDWNVRLALVNDSDETLTFGPLQDSIVITEEGYQYPARLIDDALYNATIPPGFRAVSHGLLYSQTEFAFRTAASSTPSEIILLPDLDNDRINRRVDISQVINVDYPIDGQPNNIPALIDARLEVPGRTLISFEDVRLQKEESSYVDYSLVIEATFANYDKGYASSELLRCNVFSRLGSVFAGDGIGVTAGPSQTAQFIIRVPFATYGPSTISTLEGGILHCWLGTTAPVGPSSDILEVLAVLPVEFTIAEEAP